MAASKAIEFNIIFLLFMFDYKNRLLLNEETLIACQTIASRGSFHYYFFAAPFSM